MAVGILYCRGVVSSARFLDGNEAVGILHRKGVVSSVLIVAVGILHCKVVSNPQGFCS